MAEMTLWGFNNSTYVRTVKMVLAEKHFTAFKQVPLNVLAGDPKTPEHLERHPFGKVPVLDHDGLRILETSAIARYLNDVLPGKSLVPPTPRDRARMDMIVGIVDSYGYGALVGGVAAYHLFPDFVGGKNDALLQAVARKRPPGGRVRDEDARRFAIHRRRTQSRRSLSRADHRLCRDDAGQEHRLRRPGLFRLVGRHPGAAEFQGDATRLAARHFGLTGPESGPDSPARGGGGPSPEK